MLGTGFAFSFPSINIGCLFAHHTFNFITSWLAPLNFGSSSVSHPIFFLLNASRDLLLTPASNHHLSIPETDTTGVNGAPSLYTARRHRLGDRFGGTCKALEKSPG